MFKYKQGIYFSFQTMKLSSLEPGLELATSKQFLKCLLKLILFHQPSHLFIQNKFSFHEGKCSYNGLQLVFYTILVFYTAHTFSYPYQVTICFRFFGCCFFWRLEKKCLKR